VGWLGWRSAEDEDLIRAIADACAYDAGTDVNLTIGLEDRLGDAADSSELVDEPQRHPKAKVKEKKSSLFFFFFFFLF
jgi:myotubularin-related protein 3/4